MATTYSSDLIDPLKKKTADDLGGYGADTATASAPAPESQPAATVEPVAVPAKEAPVTTSPAPSTTGPMMMAPPPPPPPPTPPPPASDNYGVTDIGKQAEVPMGGYDPYSDAAKGMSKEDQYAAASAGVQATVAARAGQDALDSQAPQAAAQPGTLHYNTPEEQHFSQIQQLWSQLSAQNGENPVKFTGDDNNYSQLFGATEGDIKRALGLAQLNTSAGQVTGVSVGGQPFDPSNIAGIQTAIQGSDLGGYGGNMPGAFDPTRPSAGLHPDDAGDFGGYGSKHLPGTFDPTRPSAGIPPIGASPPATVDPTRPSGGIPTPAAHSVGTDLGGYGAGVQTAGQVTRADAPPTATPGYTPATPATDAKQDYLGTFKQGQDAIDAKYQQIAEEQLRSFDEQAARRGLDPASSIYQDERRHVVANLDAARKGEIYQAQRDLMGANLQGEQLGQEQQRIGNQDRQYAASLAEQVTSRLQQEGQFSRSLASDESQRAISNSLAQHAQDLQKTGMDRDEAYRQSALAIDTQIRKAAQAFQQTGMDRDEAYRQAVLKMQQDQWMKEFDERQRQYNETTELNYPNTGGHK